MPTLCVILARAGSKGLASKNVTDLMGRPLIEYTFDHVRAAGSLDAIVLSTDEPRAVKLAEQRGIACIDRPAELADDTATIDAAATAAHYGSISIVTFVAATQAVSLSGLESSGFLVAAAALMETPAIMTALLLVRRERTRSEDEPGGGTQELFREVALNASVVTLIGALIIGWVTGTPGMAKVEPFFVTPLQGVLCLFLLDMGLAAGRGLRKGYKMLGLTTVVFGFYMPLVSGLIATLVCMFLPISTGDAALFITLAASSSYIAVPAAMRLALPEAKPYIYLTLSLGVTFPFNLTVGIPLYILAAQWVAS